MKRFLSLFLVLATLLCLFPMAISATEEGVGGETPEATATYLDLYVKDGLVALFDGFAVAAADKTAQKLLTPAPLYGVEGYEDYIDPSLYTANVVYTGQAWGEYVYPCRFTNGAFSFQKIENTDRTKIDYMYYVDLDDLGALLGTTYTVQEIFTVTPQTKGGGYAPIIENGVVTNWAAISGDNYVNNQSRYGMLNLNWQERAFTSTARSEEHTSELQSR